jgi:hypothetical protein
MVARAALLRSWTMNSSACAARLEKPLHSTKAINALTTDYLEKSLDRSTTGRSAWACSSKYLRDARSSIAFRNRSN